MQLVKYFWKYEEVQEEVQINISENVALCAESGFAGQ